jgi:hypothetical protein
MPTRRLGETTTSEGRIGLAEPVDVEPAGGSELQRHQLASRQPGDASSGDNSLRTANSLAIRPFPYNWKPGGPSLK